MKVLVTELVGSTNGPQTAVWRCWGPVRRRRHRPRSRRGRSSGRSLSMATSTKRKAAPDMGRLWDIDDLGAYIGVADPTEASKMKGFPPPIQLDGVRSRR